MTDLDHGADLRERIDRAMSDLSAPEGLTPAVLTEGHRLRRRRRVLTGVSGVAAAAVVAALVIPGLDGGRSSSGTEIATQPTAPPSADQPSAAPTPGGETPSLGPDDPVSFPDLPAGWWDMPSTEMLEVLKPLLPEGVSVVDAETRTETGDPDDPWAPGSGGLHGVLEGPEGPGSFQVLLYGTPSTDAAEPANQSRIKCRRYHDTCEPITDANGEQIGHVASNVERGTEYFEVALLGPDGGALYFYVADSTGEKPGYEPPTADAPPLTPEQLRTLAEDPAWTSYQP